MAMTFTEDQKKVIDIRDCNVLVSAAAGSGKTAVLVERILSLISDSQNPIDIDRLLVVTFTNAAAAEMRERLHNAILKRLEEEPDNGNLQRQAILVHHAQITTIDSFCLFILKNHFQEIDLDPGFTIGDPGRIKLLQKAAMEKVLEEAYAGKILYEGFYEEFIKLTDAYERKGRDTAIEEMIEKIYDFVMSLPYPEKWLEDSLRDYECANLEVFLNSDLIKNIMTDVSQKIDRLADSYEGMLRIADQPDGPDKYASLLEGEWQQLKRIAGMKTYMEMKDAICGFSFDRLPAIRKDEVCNERKKEAVKAAREQIKKNVAKIKETYFYEELSCMQEDLLSAGKLLKPLVYLTLAYIQQFQDEKRKENLIDFSDMEHLALQILVDEEGNPTDTAKLYQDYYYQVMIDEYQDSNEVQELLLSVVSRENGEKPNRFMVGDMKQSIYKFRMARPEIFLEKYHLYDTSHKQGVRIDLKQNFRSRKEVIDAVNHVFYPLMGAEVGGITYDENAALYAGALYPLGDEGKEREASFHTELLIYEDCDEEGNKADVSKEEGEAAMIALRIRDLLENGLVTDKKTGTLRAITYDDIVILVRSTAGLMGQIQEALKQEGIPVSVPSRTGYFSAKEVQILLKFIQILVNPGSDISLATVLKSPLYGFSDEELAEISLIEREGETKSLYQKLCLYESPKAKAFVEELKQYRKAIKTETVHDLLYEVISRHGYLEYVTALPGGAIREVNVKMLLEKAMEYESGQMRGVFGFLQYMKQLEKYEVDQGAGSEENTGCVTIMTIHKSKGLEFPVCIMAGMGKMFNRKDSGGALLLHRDMGIGMEYRNPDKRTCRKTLKQNRVSEVLRREAMGEELRVLYVAMTRAKEKLILTGSISQAGKAMENCRGISEPQYALDIEKRRVLPEHILDCNHYLKMLLYVYALYEDEPSRIPSVMIYHEEDLKMKKAGGSIQRAVSRETLKGMLQANMEVGYDEVLGSRISFAYPHGELEGLYTKTSVSELKMAALHEDEQTDVMFETEKEESIVPLFLKEEKKVSGTTRGTAYHRLMELLDFKAFANIESASVRKQVLMEQKNAILTEGTMAEADMELIDMGKVERFFESTLAKEMAQADARGKLYKEQPFVMAIEANRVNPRFPKDESMLIQGIIDAFYEKDGSICLLDYKTDRVNKKEDLIQRYQTQLDYYKEALEKLTGKEVKNIYIYSYHFLESFSI